MELLLILYDKLPKKRRGGGKPGGKSVRTVVEGSPLQARQTLQEEPALLTPLSNFPPLELGQNTRLLFIPLNLR